MSDDSSLIGLVILVAVIWFFWNLNSFDGEIIAYQQIYRCEKMPKNICEWKNIRYITYAVNSNSQTVVSWPSDNLWNLRKEKNCVVVSKRHWECGEKYYRYGFYDGNYIIKDTEKKRYVSILTWWFNKL